MMMSNVCKKFSRHSFACVSCDIPKQYQKPVIRLQNVHQSKNNLKGHEYISCTV